ncbi:MAG: hypothetical protein H7255_20595, partial [Ramlibacter sp.]|nr:hypothetical protein [Ramlibacter sp.]
MIDGTEQRERRPSALSPDHFRVDETSFGRLVSTAEGFASHLRLHESTGDSQQTWAALFDSDELMVLATIVGYDASPIRNWLLEDFDAVPEDRLAKAVLKLSSALDGWYRKLQLIDADGARAVAGTIALAIERQLADDMQWLGANFAPDGWQGDIHGYGKLDPAWFVRPSTLRRREGRTKRETLRGAFFAMLDTIDRAKEAAQERMPDSLASRTHDPAAGLYAAFLQLFQGVQQHVNGFTAKHTSFYYNDVLQMKPRRAQPDRVHLVCEPVPGVTAGVRVPAGTVFAAGKDDSLRPVEFISHEELVVTDVKVAALSTLRLERAPLVLGDDRFDCVKRVKADKPATVDAGGGALPYWPIFGGGAGQGAPAAPDAEFGLAIASPALFLKEGHRDIRITLQMRNTADNGGLWARMADGSSQVQWQFVRALPQLFRICFTTATGWWEATDCFVARRADSHAGLDGLELTIRLQPEAPSITGCIAALHGPGWNTQLPIARIGVRQDAALCAYSLLDRALLEQVVIDTRVRGVRDIVLANQYGRLDPSTPFMPFGPMPQLGSYLVFGSPEAAAKQLQRVRLNVEWSGLPQSLGGFPEHYQGYDSDFPNLGFKAKMSVLQDGAWRTSATDPEGRPMFVERP